MWHFAILFSNPLPHASFDKKVTNSGMKQKMILFSICGYIGILSYIKQSRRRSEIAVLICLHIHFWPGNIATLDVQKAFLDVFLLLLTVIISGAREIQRIQNWVEEKMGLEKFEMSDVNSLTALPPPYMGICHFLVGTHPLPPSWVTHFLNSP